MADEPEDVAQTARNPGGPRTPARRERTYTLFLEELRQHSPLPVERLEKTLVPVLCALKQSLERDDEEDLRARLPLKLQEILKACEPRHDHPSCRADVDGLLEQVARELSADKDQAESVTRSVLSTVRAQLNEGEAEHVGDSPSGCSGPGRSESQDPSGKDGCTMKTLGEVMTREVETLAPHTNLRLAAEVMRRLRTDAVPICEDGTLVGLVTQRDLVVRGLALGKDPDRTPVSAVMLEQVDHLPPDASLQEAVALMRQQRLPRLLVVDDDAHLVGIVLRHELLPSASDQAPH
jgi:CBS domain-containing protein/uncharacterized protein (DUF2267 family)